MPIEFVCKSCSDTLSVPDEHGGKQAKCPTCEQLNLIPMSSLEEPSDNPFSTVADLGSPSAANLSNTYEPTLHPASQIPKPQQIAASPFRPLYDSVFFMKFIAWYCIVLGVLYCLTIVGLVFGWLPIWLGVCLKNAARDIENGFPSANTNLLHSASSNLATVAQIAGICCMIGAAFIALYLVFIIFALIIGFVGAASGM